MGFQSSHSPDSGGVADHARSAPSETAALVGATHLRRLLDAVMVVGSQLSLSAVLLRIIETGTELVGARYGALGVLDPSGTQLTDFVTVGIDDEQARLIGGQPQGHGLLGLLIVTPVPLRMPDLNAHPHSGGFPPNHPPMASFLGVPILLRDAVFGNLYFADKSDDQPFSEVDEQLAVALAAAAALAIENTRLNERKHAMKLLEERERIARDLHDDVIQRVFAAGLALHVTAQMSTEPAVTERLIQIGSDLDVTIREVRNTIFRLNDRRAPNSVRAEIAALCTESTPTLGFAPSCHTRGPIDESVSAALARDAVSVVREALSNVVRHARATRVDVLVVVDGRHLVIEVTDDGMGLPTGERVIGNGLANMRDRAIASGGTFRAGGCLGGGTRLVWDVPVDLAAA